MKRPDFNIAHVSRVETSTNNTALKVISDRGHEMTLNISPPGRLQLIQALLTVPPVEAAGALGELPRFVLRGVSTRLYEGQNSVTILEVNLGQGMTVHIELDGLLPDDLHRQLTGWLAPSTPPQTH